MHDDLICPVDQTIDQSVTVVHLYPSLPPYAETIRYAGEVKIRCANVRFAAARGTS
jgi:hypothetical protein